MKLNEYPIFNKLEENARIFLKKHLKPVSVKKGNILFYQGDICKDILWLTKGEVKLYRQEDGPEELTIYILKPGEQCIVNTASLLSQTNAVASAVTLTDIEGYLINEKIVRELSYISNIYHRYLFSLYHIRFESLTQLIGDLKFKNTDVRIIEWLKKQDNKTVHITHEQLAIELGTTRVTVSRILKNLENENKVILHRGEIELL